MYDAHTGRQLLLVWPYLYHRWWKDSKMCIVKMMMMMMMMMMIEVDESSFLAVRFLMCPLYQPLMIRTMINE
jgi:hypothetical protein